MSDFQKAKQDAVDAAANSDQLAQIVALLQAQQLVPQQPPTPTPVAPQSSGGAAKWIGIGVGGSIFLITVALSAVAVAISAAALTVCLLVLRSIWQDVRKGR
ncbi:hypothetical protein [Streptomyces sp. S063]|uniref:hypothetical protein n=1 Tax=Streptomyces sp. S063 TaxID=2005885 RepID=UPI00100833B1|nr:hypothetical protein [Streptomyces sp. S063]